MNTKTRYVLPLFAAVFALMFAAATPYVIAEPGQEKDWSDGNSANDYPKKDIRQDMAEKLNAYCQMSPQEQAELIEEHNKTKEMVAKMNEYCSLDEAGKQAFIDEHKDQYRKHLGDKMRDDYKKHHMKVKVEGFTGLIQVPDMSEIEDKMVAHDAIKEQVTVKLSQAASVAEGAGLDVMKGSIGMVVNEDGVKSVAWRLVAMNDMDNDNDVDSDKKMSKTIFVVDAADITNTAQTTKEFDHSQMMTKQKEDKRYSSHGTGYNNENTLSSPEQIQNKIEKIEDKIAKGTGNADMDALKTQFVDLLKQLQTAITNGDDTQADSLREQLQDLRNQMTDMKRPN